MLKDIFLRLCEQYSGDLPLISQYWDEIVRAYSGKKRYYHNLQHLHHLYQELEPVRDQILNRNALLFSLFYHDIVYISHRKDNEEQSALVAQERLISLGVPGAVIQLCMHHIHATKVHQQDEDPDTNLFTDADLSILGADWNTYERYFKHVRKEYALFPYFLYKKGRKQALLHFLEMPGIYKTAHFRQLYEEQARNNLQAELQLL